MIPAERRRIAVLAGVLVSLVVWMAPLRVHGAGALFVNGAGEPLVWDGAAVPWNPDLGSLGALDAVAARALVASSFDVWAAVPTASISFVDAGALPVDVTAQNATSFIGVCGDGLSPIIFDADGSITDLLLGLGASNVVLGFAGPECGTFTPARITEASAVLNGRFIDGVFTNTNAEIPFEAFNAVFVHEFGHYVNLDHTQVNLVEAFNATALDDGAVATMFPILVNGVEELSLERDDEVSLSMLYPGPALAGRGAISGRVLRNDGTTPFQGAFVIARNTADPRHDAVGCASGARYFPGAPGGPPDVALRGAYELAGLTAGADYTIEVEPIHPGFTGGSSVGPFNVPLSLPGPSEFWSGDDEAAFDPPDDPASAGVPIRLDAGLTIGDVDIVLNAIVPPPNDDCSAAAPIDTFPFMAASTTIAATSMVDDPPQECTRGGPAPNANTVWYRVVAPDDGVLALSTAGSGYDTVLSAYTGRCGALAAVACNDDAGGPQSAVSFQVSAGTPYLVEIADFGSAGGGTLRVAASFDPLARATCTAPAPGICIPGTGRRSSNCVAEWIVEPTPLVRRKRSAPDHRIVCRDGDPRCDFDGVADGRCSFHVGVCVNNHDPRPGAARCVPTTVSSYEVLMPRARRPRDAADVENAASLLATVASLGPPAVAAGAALRFDPALTGSDRCSAYRTLVVPIGTRVFRSRASPPIGKPDVDTLRLRCIR